MLSLQAGRLPIVVILGVSLMLGPCSFIFVSIQTSLEHDRLKYLHVGSLGVCLGAHYADLLMLIVGVSFITRL